MNADPYCYPGTNVLMNKLNIVNPDLLKEMERTASYRRANELYEKPIKGNFDLQHMQSIHKYIFQDVYPWAGEIRTVGIQKGSSKFCLPQYIEGYANDTFKKLRKDDYLKGLDPATFSRRAAELMADLNAGHFFREGNGRTQREFMRELALNVGYKLELSNTPKELMIQASLDSFNGNNQKLEQLIKTQLKPLRGMEKKMDMGPKM